MKYNEYYSSDVLRDISVSFGKFDKFMPPVKTGKVVLSFQFYCPHWFTVVGSTNAIWNIASYFPSGVKYVNPLRTFYVNIGKDNYYTHDDWPYYSSPQDKILHALISFCEQAELFAKNFYTEIKNEDGDIEYYTGAGIGTNIRLGDYDVVFVNYTTLSKDIKNWITSVSLGDSPMSGSSQIIHGSFSQTYRPSEFMSKLAALGVEFQGPTSVVPVGFEIPSEYDNSTYLGATCNFFYRFLMPAVATISANEDELPGIEKAMKNLFSPFITNTAGFKLVFNVKYFKDEEVA